MNELIKQLAEQAMETVDVSKKLGMPGIDLVFNKEKFAELILTEVISTIYRSDISDKKQEKLVDELAYKFGIK